MIPAMFFAYTDLVDYLPFSESIIFAIYYFTLFYGACNSLWFLFACIFTRMNLRRFARTSPSAPAKQEDTTRGFKLYIARDLVFLCLVILAETYLIIYIMLILFYEIDTFGKGFFELAFYWLMIQ